MFYYKVGEILKFNEIPYQSLDYSKIKKTLGWKPKESIRSTAKKIFEWYKNIP